MPIVNYRMVSGSTLREIHDQVVQLERQGYRPFGQQYKTIASGSGKPGGNQFRQAMIRTERDSESVNEIGRAG